MYKSYFKDLKRKCPPPDHSNVVDFDDLDKSNAEVVRKHDLFDVKVDDANSFLSKHVKPTKDWEVYELTAKPGLLFIRNPFTWLGQRYWICRCLQDFSLKPNRLNLDAHNELKPEEIWWESSQGKDSRSEALRKKLRWATLGYHHDWNTKVYNESARDPFPADLAELSRFVAKAIGFTEAFEAQAAIVNFYHLDSTLSGHTDHSEEHATAPLLSFSFGQTAIFLLGGQSIEDVPTPVFIKSGDIVIMSGYSRLCYHGIPKILKSTYTPWESATALEHMDSDFQDGTKRNCGQNACVNDSTNQPKPSPAPENVDSVSEEVSVPSPKSKKRKVELGCEVSSVTCAKRIDCSQLEHLMDDKMWLPFKSYVEFSRINVNVRQVLFAGQKALKSGQSIDCTNGS